MICNKYTRQKTITDPSVLEDPAESMEQFQKLTSAISDIWTNQQMILERVKALELALEEKESA